MNGYIAIYKGKQIEVYTDSSDKAQLEAAKQFKAKKSYEVSVYLCEKDGQPVTQSTCFYPRHGSQPRRIEHGTFIYPYLSLRVLGTSARPRTTASMV